MPKIQKTTSRKTDPTPQQDTNPALVKIRKRVMVQSALAATAVLLTVVMLFAMTAAWYTNIVHTAGLTFEVEQWGFDGNVVSNTPPIVAGPGDDGLIHLEVTSNSTSPAAVSVNVSKETMSEVFQQRIYFYVDASMERSGEIMERVYLNSRESYTYDLFSQGKLTLTETYHNAPQIKWQWVYDVLGYYVLGNPITDEAGNRTGFAISEYLRPIEYNYDYASVGLNAETNELEIQTIGGTYTPEEFLVKLSETDGYPGFIDPTSVTADGYYLVQEENGDTGFGVYAYLCSYAEVEAGIAKDTELAQTVQQPSGSTDYSKTARLLVSAQKSENNVVNVTTLDGLQEAVNLGLADTIQLSDNLNLVEGQQLVIPAGAQVMLDMGENSIKTTDPDTIPVVVQEGGSLTVVNGTLTGNGNSCAIEAVGAEIVMNKVNIDGFELGMMIEDSAAAKATDSVIRLVDCKWNTNDCSMLIYGNGSQSGQRTQIVVEDCTLTSNNMTICGNGTHYGTDIQIINSTVTSNESGKFSGIYHPQQDSVLTIYNSTVSGYTGLAIKGGEVNLIGAKVYGKGAGMGTVSSFSNSGFNDTGDAVYIETNYGYPIELNVSNLEILENGETKTIKSELISDYQYGLRVHESDAAHVKIKITGGAFKKVQNTTLFETYYDHETAELVITDGSTYNIQPKSTSTGT